MVSGPISRTATPAQPRPTRRILKSSTFRLALLYLVLFGASILVVLAFIHWQTAGFMARQTDEAIQAEIRGLEEQYTQRGTIGLVQALNRRTQQSRATGGLYLLADPNYRPLAGNLTGWPEEEPDAEGWVTFRLEYANESSGRVKFGRARLFELRGELHLLVGRDIRERTQIIALIEETLGWGIALALLLSVVGGALVTRPLLRRIDAVNETSREIMSGDLSRRIPENGSGDEFDQLARNLNAMLDQIERLLDGMKQVSDNVAHDLRRPLARLRSRLEVTLMDTQDTVAYRDAIQRTIEEADSLLATFNALLDIARAEAGASARAFEETGLKPLLEDVAELYEPLAEEKGLTFSLEAPADVMLSVDRHLLAQALANLIDNAVKFTPGGGEVTVSLAEADGGAVLGVSDSGPGIPEADRERVLDRFVRLDSSRSTEGSGLGLSLAAAVARLHGGSLVLGDNAPGLKAKLFLPQR